MSIRTLLPFLQGPAPVHGNRSSMTCKMKCGDACFHEVPNTSDNEYFADVVASAVSRRGFLRAGAVIGAATAFGTIITGAGGRKALAAPQVLEFDAVQPAATDSVVIPEGWAQDIVMRWGDKLFSSAPDFDPLNQTPEAQAQQFGYNCDFLGFFPLDDEHELMMVNHEYTNEYIMFPDFDPESTDADKVDIALAAHGLSVVAVAKEAGTGRLTPVVDHDLNKRHTGDSPFELTGPVAGHELVRTSGDAEGRYVRGTLNNCAGGLTPWGTWLSGEENFNQYFANAAQSPDEVSVQRHARYGIPTEGTERLWETVHGRFDIAQEPNEIHRFGWVVEINPFAPDEAPKKRTALGRFKHEAGTSVLASDGRAVVYSGDDERFDYLYKFVSDDVVDMSGDLATRAAANAGILDRGTLYVARFTGNSPASEITGDGSVPADGAFDGSGEWIPLVHSDGETAESFVDGMTAEEVLLFTRLAGDAVGATKMDRPEDVETSPVSGKVYMALTNNTNRAVEDNAGVDEANPRSANKHGHIIEMIEAGDDHATLEFGWNILLLAGDPNDPSTYFAGFDKSQVSPISCPDNVTFDSAGNLWVSTDGNALGAHDGLYEVVVEGESRGRVKQFLSVPTGSECCGPWVTDERVNVAIQHPGETDEASFDDQSSHWPDGGDSIPRPSIVTAWPVAAGGPSEAPSPSPSPTSGPSDRPTEDPTGEPSKRPDRPGMPKTGA